MFDPLNLSSILSFLWLRTSVLTSIKWQLFCDNWVGVWDDFGGGFLFVCLFVYFIFFNEKSHFILPFFLNIVWHIDQFDFYWNMKFNSFCCCFYSLGKVWTCFFLSLICTDVGDDRKIMCLITGVLCPLLKVHFPWVNSGALAYSDHLNYVLRFTDDGLHVYACAYMCFVLVCGISTLLLTYLFLKIVVQSQILTLNNSVVC